MSLHLSQRSVSSVRWMVALALLGALFASALMPQATHAASPIFVDDDAADGGDGLSWATALNDLESAIEMAAPGEEVWVAEGTYYPTYLVDPADPRSATFYLKGNVAVYGGFTGTETQLTQRTNPLDHPTILDGLITPEAPDTPYRVYHVVRLNNSFSAGTRLDGFIVMHGQADNAIPAMGRDRSGAGVEIFDAQVILANLIIRDNQSQEMGGGLGLSNSTATLLNVRVENNNSGQGGGIFHYGGSGSSFTNVTVANNQATGDGGGMFEVYTNSVFESVTFQGNSAGGDGGGILVTNAVPVLRNCTFNGNSAGTHGGALSIPVGGAIRIENCVFDGNHAGTIGGGIYNNESDTLIYRSTFTNNYAVIYGGALQSRSSTMQIISSRFIGNHTDSMGGAVDYTANSDGIVANSVFIGNHAAQGGGMRIEGLNTTPVVYNSTFANNYVGGTNPHGAGIIHIGMDETAHSRVINCVFYNNTGVLEDMRVYNANIEVSYTITGHMSAANGGQFTNLEATSAVNPQFLDLDGADNIAGTADDDLRLASTSPAVDAGMNYGADVIDADNDGDTAEPFPFDFDARARVVDVAGATNASSLPIDLGAYEVQLPVLEMTKVAGSGSIFEATAFPVTITLTNTGLGTASSVVLSDDLDGLEMLPGTLTRSRGSAGTLPVLATGFALLPGESITVSYQARVADGPGMLNRAAQVTAYELAAPVMANAAINVQNLPPTSIAITLPGGTVYEGDPAQYSVTYSDAAGDLDAPFSAYWLFDDGSAEVPGIPLVQHTYADSRTYNLRVRVCDGDSIDGNDANCTTSAPVAMTVTNRAPQLSLNPVLGSTEGQLISFTGSFTDVAGALDVPYTYQWTLDASTPIENGTVNTYTGQVILTSTARAFPAGNHTVTLRVQDQDGSATSITSSQFTITNIPPQVSVHVRDDAAVYEGEPATLEAVVTDPGSTLGETYSYAWNFGSGFGTPDANADEQHTFADSGAYSVQVRVTDSNGGVTTSTPFNLTVLNRAPVASIQPVGAANEGDSIIFHGSFIDNAGALDTPYTYEWELDGTVLSTSSVSSYPAALTATEDLPSGDHTIRLRVRDADLDYGAWASAAFTVSNVAPTVGVPNHTGAAVEGSTVSFSGSFTDPGQQYGGETYTYVWNFGDGTGNFDTTATTGLSTTHIFAQSGTYDVTLMVGDGQSPAVQSAAYHLTIANQTPTPSVSPVVGAVEGTPVTFTGSFTDPAQALDLPYSYRWLLDGVEISAGTVSAYPPGTISSTPVAMLAGSHMVRLEVHDKDNLAWSGVDRAFSVENVTPTVTITPLAAIDDGSAAAFSLSFTDPGQAFSETYTYQWLFDGVLNGITTSSVSFNFATQGAHTVTARVTDGHGATGATTITVTVNNAAPAASISGITGVRNEGTTLSFNGSGSDPSRDPAHTGIAGYAWDFGDGATGSGTAATHAYRDNGTYIVTLTVTDNQGATGTASITVTIANVAPVVDAGQPVAGKVGVELAFHGTLTDPGVDDTFTIRWDFGDGMFVEGTALSLLDTTHAYTKEGAYTVSLTVTDKDGGTHTDTTIANVDQYRFFVPLAIGGGK